MRVRLGNPLRDESAAFGVLVVTLAALGLVVLAARLVSPLAGVAVVLAELAAAGWLVRASLIERRRAVALEREASAAADVADTPADTPASPTSSR